ncbi:MAG: hypothetical protein AAB019_05725 [Planctomycetota bacterium]
MLLIKGDHPSRFGKGGKGRRYNTSNGLSKPRLLSGQGLEPTLISALAGLM